MNILKGCIKEDKYILREINEVKVHFRRLSYEFCKTIGVFKILYPNIKQPYKRWYKKER